MDNRLELARILLKKAADDLAMARTLAGNSESPEWGIGFHIQQSIEKAMKSVLNARGVEYPRTHNLSLLVDLLAENSLQTPVRRESLVILTSFGVLFRYDEMGPSDTEFNNLPNRDSLLEIAEALVLWASELIARA